MSQISKRWSRALWVIGGIATLSAIGFGVAIAIQKSGQESRLRLADCVAIGPHVGDKPENYYGFKEYNRRNAKKITPDEWADVTFDFSPKYAKEDWPHLTERQLKLLIDIRRRVFVENWNEFPTPTSDKGEDLPAASKIKESASQMASVIGRKLCMNIS